MTTHAENVAARLPLLYRDGELVRDLLDVVGLQLEILDEEGRQVQRRHWIGTVPDLDEAVRLGELLDIRAEPWQSLGEYLAWFHALRTARLVEGGVTGGALRTFVRMYVERFEAANRLDTVRPLDDDSWLREPATAGNSFVENPPRLVADRLGGALGVEPLTKRVARNGGLDPTPLSILATGLTAGPEYLPLIANVTTGEALIYMGIVPVGMRLWITAAGDGVSAELGREDVTHRLRSVTRLVPGDPWDAADVAAAPRSIRLLPGDNTLWFLPVAHFDEPGLDRVLLALAELDLEPGRWDETRYDHAVFAQDPAVAVELVWAEASPASVRIDLDAGIMRTEAEGTEAGLEARDQLDASVRQGVRSLSAAGVAADVRLRPFVSSQRQRDHLVSVLPLGVAEVGVTGIDRLPDSGGTFDVTDFDDSTYR